NRSDSRQQSLGGCATGADRRARRSGDDGVLDGARALALAGKVGPRALHRESAGRQRDVLNPARARRLPCAEVAVLLAVTGGPPACGGLPGDGFGVLVAA